MDRRRHLAAIVFMDLARYSEFMSEDEALALGALKKVRKLVKRVARRHKGLWLESPGESNLLRFGSATDAVNFALRVQAELGDSPDIGLKAGIHVGEVIESDGHIYGDGVNVASRIEQLAEPGGIVVSETVFDSIKNKRGLNTRNLGAKNLKNVDHPVRVYALSGRPASIPRLGDLELPGRTVRLAWTSAFVAVGAAAILTIALYTSQPGIEAAPNSVAVLPFENLSGDPEYAYFGDGLAEELLNTLARVSALRVAARRSSFYYRDKGANVREIANNLNVSTILEGSVRRSNGQLRVSVQLVDAEDGFQMWAETYNTRMDNIFQVQSSISLAVAEELVSALSEDAITSLNYEPTKDITAYDLYLRGRVYMQQPKDPEVVQSAISLFRSALDRDPSFAQAHAGLCEAFVSQFQQSRNPSHADSAEKACTRALDLDERLPVVRTAIGNLHLINGRLDRAESELMRATKESSQPADAYRTLAKVYHAQGRLDDAERAFEKAIEIQPAHQRGYTALGNFYYRTDRFEKAADQYEKVTELYPDAASAYNNLGAAHYMLRNFGEAAKAWEKSGQLNPTFHTHYNLGNMYYYMGRFHEAEKGYRKATQLAPDSYLAWGGVGAALSQIAGREEQAVSAYEHARSNARQAVEVNPKDFNAHARLALYCDRTGETGCTSEQMSKARELGGDDPVLDFVEALIVVDEDKQSAAELLESAIAKGYPAFLVRSEPKFKHLQHQEPLRAALRQAESGAG